MAVTKYPTVPIRVSVPVHDRIAAIAQELSDKRGRPVTLGEVIEILTEKYESNS